MGWPTESVLCLQGMQQGRQPASNPLSMPSGNQLQGASGLAAPLENAAGDHHCFLNVVIQSLWHLWPFRMAIAGVQVALLYPVLIVLAQDMLCQAYPGCLCRQL